MASNSFVGSGVFSGSEEMSRSGSRGGGTEGRKASESPLFSPPAKTRSEELKRVQLLGGKKYLKKMGIQGSATSMTYKESATVVSARPEASTGCLGIHGCSNNSLTNDLLQLLVSEIARMRCTLDSLAQDKALLAEVQKSNKLLALSLVCGHRLEFCRDVPTLMVKTTEELEKVADVVVKTLSPQCKMQPHLNDTYST